jgi:hypothetical protein
VNREGVGQRAVLGQLLSERGDILSRAAHSKR